MTLSRSMEARELSASGGRLWVTPCPFAGSSQSTTPAGTWSFWFAGRTYLPLAEVFVVAEFEPEARGAMEFSETEEPSGEMHYYSVPEYVTSEPVPVSVVYYAGTWAEEEETGMAYCPLSGMVFFGEEPVEMTEAFSEMVQSGSVPVCLSRRAAETYGVQQVVSFYEYGRHVRYSAMEEER